MFGFLLKAGGKAAEKQILNHMDISGRKHTNMMYHYTHTHGQTCTVREKIKGMRRMYNDLQVQ